MENPLNQPDWHLFADRFVWYDHKDLLHIPSNVSSEEIQKYLFTFHGDDISIEEINEYRKIPKFNER